MLAECTWLSTVVVDKYRLGLCCTDCQRQSPDLVSRSGLWCLSLGAPRFIGVVSGDARGEEGHQPFAADGVFFVEAGRAGAVQVEHADDAALVGDRDDQFAA